MKLRIEVTADDITNGERRSCSRCPIARAIIRALPGRFIEVYELSLEIDNVYFRLPDRACRFITRFDLRMPVEPIEFDLEVDLEEAA